MKLVSIDPGKKYYAFAEWGTQVNLQAAGLRLIDDKIDWSGIPMAIELPAIWAGGEADVRDIIDLSVGAGRVADRAGQVTWYPAAFWKGQQPKKAHHKKIKAELKPAEVRLLEAFNKGELDHIMDAIGIGLFHLGRLV